MQGHKFMRKFPHNGIVSRSVLEGPTGVPEKRSHVQRLLKEMEQGNTLIGIARCMDCNQALVERMVKSGVHPDDLKLPNLTNKEIAALKPNAAMLLETVVKFRVKHWSGPWVEGDPRNGQTPTKLFARRMLGLQDDQGAAREPDIRFDLDDGFIVLFKQVGLVWVKP